MAPPPQEALLSVAPLAAMGVGQRQGPIACLWPHKDVGQHSDAGEHQEPDEPEPLLELRHLDERPNIAYLHETCMHGCRQEA